MTFNCVLCPKYFDNIESLLQHTTDIHHVQKNTILIFDLDSEQYVGITDEKHKEQMKITKSRPSEASRRFERQF